VNRRDFNAIALGGAATAFLRHLTDGLPVHRSTDLLVHPVQADLHVNADRINAHLVALGEFGKNPEGGVSRVAYSDADQAARAKVMEWTRAARLEPNIDFAGNIIGRRDLHFERRRPQPLTEGILAAPSTSPTPRMSVLAADKALA
jgi:hypothetical protein